jgi:FtsP/CotA-like multicopper oxidase with cupredoxin domain
MIASPCATQPAEGAPQRFELRIANGRLADAIRTIRVKRGDKVELVWSADRRTLVHLHGYDLEAAVDPAKPESMAFSARITGRFPIETHAGSGHRVLIYLEVHPR